MNSRKISFFLLLISLLFSSGCGVKSYPTAPEGTGIPSYLNQFLEFEEQKLDKAKKNKNNK
ncbi:MAG: hypothetical protein HN576_16845 [Bacteriovoracaceae bacterium]|nr:hypothetical protein [Bacteriovoracaceae bacterium]